MRPSQIASLLLVLAASALGSCALFVEIETFDEEDVFYVQTYDSPNADGSGAWRFGVVGAASNDSVRAVDLRSFRRVVPGTDFSEGIGEVAGAPDARQIAYLSVDIELPKRPREASARVEVDYAVPDSLADADIRMAIVVGRNPVAERATRDSGATDLLIDGASALRSFAATPQLVAARPTAPFATEAWAGGIDASGGAVTVTVLVEFPAGSDGGLWLRHIRLIAIEE